MMRSPYIAVVSVRARAGDVMAAAAAIPPSSAIVVGGAAYVYRAVAIGQRGECGTRCVAGPSISRMVVIRVYT